jgi:hypothetical protein
VVEARLQTLISEFEGLRMKESSNIDEFANKIASIASKSASLGTIIDEERLVKRFLNGLPRKFIHMVASLEQVVDLKTIGFDDVVGRLKAYEERIGLEDKSPANKTDQLFFSYEEKKQERGYGRGKATAESSQKGRGRGRGKTGGQGKDKEIKTRQKKDRSKLKCYRCDGLGHFASNCPTRKKTEESHLVQDDKAVLYMVTHEVDKEIVFLNEEQVDPRKYTSSPHEDETWFLDNGASNHMSGNIKWFTNLDHRTVRRVRFRDGSCVEIKGRGTVVLEGRSGEQRILSDAYYIPSLESNTVQDRNTTWSSMAI